MKELIHEIANFASYKAAGNSLTYEQILMSGLSNLNDVERKVIFLRYWSPCSIQEISGELKISWESADEIINRSIEKLRKHFYLMDDKSSQSSRDK